VTLKTLIVAQLTFYSVNNLIHNNDYKATRCKLTSVYEHSLKMALWWTETRRRKENCARGLEKSFRIQMKRSKDKTYRIWRLRNTGNFARKQACSSSEPWKVKNITVSLFENIWRKIYFYEYQERFKAMVITQRI
jgi:hypothetical protein